MNNNIADKDTLFDDRILWLGALPSVVCFFWSIGLYAHDSAAPPLWLNVVFSTVAAGFAWFLTILALTPFLAFAAWYQMYRLQYKLPRMLSAMLVLGGLVFGALISYGASLLIDYPVFHTIWSLLFIITLPLVIIGLYTERKARNKLNTLQLKSQHHSHTE